MRPDEPKSFDPHEPIDLGNKRQASDFAERFSATLDELSEAVEKVGPQPVAVAIFLGRPDAV